MKHIRNLILLISCLIGGCNATFAQTNGTNNNYLPPNPGSTLLQGFSYNINDTTAITGRQVRAYFGGGKSSRLALWADVVNNRVFNDFGALSMYGRQGLKMINPGITYIGDSNLEQYVASVVDDNNWANLTSVALQKYQGPNSGIAISNFSDPTRYGLTITGSTSVLPYGPIKQGLYMTAGSTITFTSATDFVDLYIWLDPGAGSLEFRRNGVLYRTVSANASHQENVSTFFINQVQTSSNASATYEIKAVGGDVFVTALFNKILSQQNRDTYYFMRMALAGQTFGDFNISDLAKQTGILNTSNSTTYGGTFLLALGTNSIYAAGKATSSHQYEIDLINYITGLRTSNTNLIYVIPPRTMETTYPVILEPYSNYYAVIQRVMQQYNVPFIDLNIPIQRNSAYFGSDGLHYNNAGHAVIAEYVINQLSKLDIASSSVYSTKNGEYSSLWNGQKGRLDTISSTTPTFLAAYDGVKSRWASIDVPILKTFIGNALADGATKGIASFNSTNFSASSGIINLANTIQTGAFNATSSTAGTAFYSSRNGLTLGVSDLTDQLNLVDLSGNKGLHIGYHSASQGTYLLAGSNGPATSFDIELYNGSSFITPFFIANTGKISANYGLDLNNNKITGIANGTSTNDAVNYGQLLTYAPTVATLGTNSSTITITNTTTETDIAPNLSIPAGVAGREFRATIGGVYSTPAITAGTLTIKVYYGGVGGTLIASGVASGLAAGSTNLAFDGVVKVTTLTVGTTGTVTVSGAINYSVGNNLARFALDLNNSGNAVTVNNSSASNFEITATWDTASASKIVKTTQYALEQLN